MLQYMLPRLIKGFMFMISNLGGPQWSGRVKSLQHTSHDRSSFLEPSGNQAFADFILISWGGGGVLAENKADYLTPDPSLEDSNKS